MDGGFFAGFLDLLSGRIQFCNADIFCDRVTEKMGLLDHIALHPAQIFRIDLSDLPGCDCKFS